MKKITLSVLMLGIMFMIVGSVNAETLVLENKDTNWQPIQDEISGILTYNSVGPGPFEYSFSATGLEPTTEYTLIYYAEVEDRFNDWGGHPALYLDSGTTNEEGALTLTGSADTGDLPFLDDWNADPDPDYCLGHNGYDWYKHCEGAKIWLVPSEYYDADEETIYPNWYPETFLFETDLITYDDQGPVFDNVHVEPEWPSCTEDSYIFATITDEDGIPPIDPPSLPIVLHWAYDGYPWTTTPFTTYLGDDIYRIRVPVDTPTDGEDFLYYIQAEDIFGNIAYSGSEQEPQDFVYDCEPPTANLIGDTLINEGATGNYDASGSSDSASDITFEWDCNYDELFPEWVSGSVTHQCSWEDDGIYTVAVKVTDEAENSDIATLEVIVNDLGPTAILTGDQNVDEGETGNYDASGSTSSPDLIVLYEWDCNYDELDPIWTGGLSTHDCSWEDDGTYTVAVKVTDDDGSSDTETLLVNVQDSIPTAEFSASPLSGVEPLEVQFTSLSTGYDQPLTYAWDFECNGIVDDTNPNPTHIYQQNGVYDVCLTVTDSDGSPDTEEKEGYITVLDTEPTAEFSASPLSGVEPLEVQFTSLSTAYDGIATYAWDFECDQTVDSTEQNPFHIYEQDGVYDVCLTVTDSDGSPDTEEKEGYITVLDTEPTAEFSCDPLDGTAPLTTDCTDESTSSDGINSWSWDVACDNEEHYTSNLENPSFTIHQSGVCDISLTVYEEDQDSDNEVKGDYVTVYDYAIPLQPLWNLISIPLVPKDGENDNTDINFVFDSDISSKAERVWEYNYDQYTGRNIWRYNEPTEDGSEWNDHPSRIQEIIPGYGYYIKMNEEATIYQNGNKFYNIGQGLPMPPQVLLTTGWNLIGHYGTNNVAKSEEVQDLSGGILTDLADTNILNEDALPISYLEPTKGYWSFITGQDNLWYAPSEADYAGVD